MCDTIYKIRFEVGIFFKFWAFPTLLKTNFSLFLGQVLNYWASFSLFWVGFSSQHLLGLLNFFFLTRVIKLLIIYLILKIINILIYRDGAVRFVRFSYYKTANRTAPWGVVWCGAMNYYLRCGYTISRVVWCGLCSLVNTPTCRTKTRYNPYKS